MDTHRTREVATCHMCTISTTNEIFSNLRGALTVAKVAGLCIQALTTSTRMNATSLIIDSQRTATKIGGRVATAAATTSGCTFQDQEQIQLRANSKRSCTR